MVDLSLRAGTWLQDAAKEVGVCWTFICQPDPPCFGILHTQHQLTPHFYIDNLQFLSGQTTFCADQPLPWFSCKIAHFSCLRLLQLSIKMFCVKNSLFTVRLTVRGGGVSPFLTVKSTCLVLTTTYWRQ